MPADLETQVDAVCEMLSGDVIHEVAPGPQPASRLMRSSRDFSVLQASSHHGALVLTVASALRCDVLLEGPNRAILDEWNRRLPLRSFCVVPNAPSDPHGSSGSIGSVFLRTWLPGVMLRDDLFQFAGDLVFELLKTTIYAPSELAGGEQSEAQDLDGQHIDIGRLGGRQPVVQDMQRAVDHLLAG